LSLRGFAPGPVDEPECYDIAAERLVLRVRVTPGAPKSELRGVRDGELWVRVAAAPEKGRANLELVRYLAGLLGLPRSAVTLASGETSRHKRLSLGREALPRLRAVLRRAAPG
jgi:uncharacterized protein (TIGR00251 family)